MRFLVLLAAFVFMAPHAHASDSIGKILAVRGDVRAVQMDGTLRETLKLSSAVYANEKIITGEDAKVQVLFNDKSLFTVKMQRLF